MSGTAQKGRTYEREVYTPEEVDALLSFTASRSPSAVRNHALIVTLWQSGLRIDEALELRPNDVDLRRRDIFVRHGKGDKQRHVALMGETIDEIEKWLAVRDRLELPPRAPLFCTLKGTKLYSQYVRATMQRLAKRAKWTKRAHPHGFRHTYAVGMIRAGVSPAYIQRQLGHSSLATTTIYLSSISSDDIAEAIQGVDFRAAR